MCEERGFAANRRVAMLVLRVAVVALAVGALPLAALILCVSIHAREWFFGYALWPLLSSTVDRMFRRKKARLFEQAALRGRVLDLGAGLGVNFNLFKAFPSITQ